MWYPRVDAPLVRCLPRTPFQPRLWLLRRARRQAVLRGQVPSRRTAGEAAPRAGVADCRTTQVAGCHAVAASRDGFLDERRAHVAAAELVRSYATTSTRSTGRAGAPHAGRHVPGTRARLPGVARTGPRGQALDDPLTPAPISPSQGRRTGGATGSRPGTSWPRSGTARRPRSRRAEVEAAASHGRRHRRVCRSQSIGRGRSSAQCSTTG